VSSSAIQHVGHVRRIEVIEIRGILMAQERLPGGRLPDRIVLRQPRSGQLRQGRRELADSPRQRDARQHPVRLPHVAQLAGQVGRGHARHVVDLVGRQTGLPPVLERAHEVLADPVDLAGVQELLDDQESVAPVALDLPLGRSTHARQSKAPG
jgi:hypothetical protein